MTTRDNGRGPLLPYLGPQVWRDGENESHKTRYCSSDNAEQYEKYLQEHFDPSTPPEHRVDGDWEYEFNSLGFRGEEYDPLASRNIFVVGDSLAFGLGVKWEQTWAHHLRNKLGDGINLLNFSQPGMSSDYVTRVALTQSAALKPDLLLVVLSYKVRTEYVSATEIVDLSPGSVLEREVAKPEHCELAAAYYSYYTDELGLLSQLKNALLVQNHCESRGIDYLILNSAGPAPWSEGVTENPVCLSLANLLNHDRLYTPYVTTPGVKQDVARNNVHPGSRSNQAFAELLFSERDWSSAGDGFGGGPKT